jgi:Polyketide cyclase / dehydrase and lipid transport
MAIRSGGVSDRTRTGDRLHHNQELPAGSRAAALRRSDGPSLEVTEHDPPRKVSFRGTAGPVRPVTAVTVEPVGDGSRSRVSLELDLQGHGFGKLVAPFARRQAAREVQQDHERLKERLEAGV